MKKFFSFAVTAMAILGLGSLTSCHDEDFDVSTTVLQEHAFEQGFIKEFGKPSPDQSWDFYAQMMESLRDKAGATRATMAIDFDPEDEKYLKDATQPSGTDFQTMLQNQIDKALKDKVNNRNVGQNTYSLVSTGIFNIYAVRYVGSIETGSGNQFRFGMAYMDDTDGDGVEEEVMVELFQNHSVDANNNPKLGKTINFPKGKSFYFYIQYYESQLPNYTLNNSHKAEDFRTVRFYSNQVPSFVTDRTETRHGRYPNYTYTYDYTYATYSDFSGTSTLLYSSEINGKQYMIIGFEDAWAYSNNRPTGSKQPDYDFNDIVIVLEGALPEPTSKRFFCEDLQSYDWDYNDVVFDVTSRGVVLRAVGGTLPVYLEITDKNNTSWTSTELHELMWDLQADGKTVDGVYVPGEKEKHPVKTFVKNGKTYYKPIRVGANPGLPIEAVNIGPVWDYADMAGGGGNGLALSDEEVIAFANPKAERPVGGVKLIVGTVDRENIVTDAQTVVKDGSFTVISTTVGTAPAIWSAPSSVAWMKERVKITDGYPGFYEGGEATEQTGGIPAWWSTVNLAKTYQFSGDVDPDRVGN